MRKGQNIAQDKIKKDLFEQLCSMWCTLVEIAEFFDVSEDTVETWCVNTYGETFSETFKRKASKGKMSLRRWQFDSARKGNVTMQIWLGKQYLNQKETIDVNNNEISKLDEILKEIEKDANK